MQKYLLPSEYNITKEDIKTIRVLNVKMNMKGIYESNECEVCLMKVSPKSIYMNAEKYGRRKKLMMNKFRNMKIFLMEM
jgi:hypothetical protein